MADEVAPLFTRYVPDWTVSEISQAFGLWSARSRYKDGWLPTN
jgi:hypothetical protein